MRADQLTEIDAWLDEGVTSQYKRQPLAQDWGRLSKIAEELGEATQAFIGYTGQNPRKGEYGEMTDVLGELADVAVTAILAIQHFTKDGNRTLSIMDARWERVLSRVPQEARCTP